MFLSSQFRTLLESPEATERAEALRSIRSYLRLETPNDNEGKVQVLIDAITETLP